MNYIKLGVREYGLRMISSVNTLSYWLLKYIEIFTWCFKRMVQVCNITTTYTTYLI